METFNTFSKMPPIPNMTPEKWNSLSELQREEIISEYNVLGYYDAKKRAFKLGKKTLMILGVICFIIMFIFAFVAIPTVSKVERR